MHFYRKSVEDGQALFTVGYWEPVVFHVARGMTGLVSAKAEHGVQWVWMILGRKELLLTGIAALFLATGTAHAYPTTPEGEPNPLELPKDHIIARVPHKYGEPSCKLDMEVVKNRLRTRSNCWERDVWLRTSDKDHGCIEATIDKVERQDDISFLEYAHCGSHSMVFLHKLEGPRGSNHGIYDTEYY